MKNLKRMIVATLLFVVSLLNVQAQDVITLKNGKEIDGKITELTDIAVKYYDYGDEDQLIFTLDRALIDNIAFQSGKKMKEIPPTVIDENYFTGDRKNMFKLNFTALGGNSTILTYERSLKPEYSIETSLKIVGIGFDENRSSDFFNYNEYSGIGLDVGMKFKTKAIFKKSGEYRPRHLLVGTYIKPVVGVNSLKVNGNTKNFGNIGIDLGKQWVFANRFTLDAFVGYHYILGNQNQLITRTENGYTYTYTERTVKTGDLTAYNNKGVSFGVKIGFLIGDKK